MAFNPPKYTSDSYDLDSPNVQCNYYSPSSLKNMMVKCPQRFSILPMNIRSCRKNFASFHF